MNNINKLYTFISENRKDWRKVCSKDYVVIDDGETLFGTATLFTAGKHGWCREHCEILLSNSLGTKFWREERDFLKKS